MGLTRFYETTFFTFIHNLSYAGAEYDANIANVNMCWKTTCNSAV